MSLELETNHFTSYQYYRNLNTQLCTDCDDVTSHLMLRYRTFLAKKNPFIPTRNTYYFVCTKCGHYHEIENEFTLIKLLQEGRSQRPVKYNNESYKNLASIENKEVINDIVKYNILIHLNDMK